MKIIIDAEGGILGRIASHAAKQALRGNEVIVVNCANALITGRKENTLSKYKQLRAKGGSSLKGPKLQRSAERIMKRVIRGMLPHKQERGRTALRKIKCYSETPEEYKDTEKIQLIKEVHAKTLELEKLAREL